MARKRAQRQRRPRGRANNNQSNALLTTNGELRTVHVSAGAVKASKSVGLNPTNFPQLKASLVGCAEYNVINAVFTWEPMVTPFSDSGMVGLVATHTEDLLDALPVSDVDGLLRAGMALRPASTRRSVQFNTGKGEWWLASSSGRQGGVYVYCTKPGTQDLGRLSGVLTIRVRGVGALP